MRTTTKNRSLRDGAGKLLLLACVSLCAVIEAALVTTCNAGEYLLMNEQNLPAREGLCVTCPAGK